MDTTNRHIGNLLSRMTDKDIKEVFEQYAHKLGFDESGNNEEWETKMLKHLRDILMSCSFDYLGNRDGRRFMFRGRATGCDHVWLDDDTFVFQFGDGEFTDPEGRDYFIHLEYHVQDNEWVTEVFWEDSSEPAGFDGSEEYITEREIEEIKEFAKQFMD